MAIYLSLGSNRGDRRENLRSGLTALTSANVVVERVSPVVESPALLPAQAPPDWNSPYLNLVAECSGQLGPEELLVAIKQIEQRLGRSDERHWAPRPIDIDILLYDDAVVSSDRLTIPHPAMTDRAFVMTPLAALNPGLMLPGAYESDRPISALAASRALGHNIPLWMGIVNLTPDSFSDGGLNDSWAAVESRIDSMVAAGVHCLDFGAESTRPGASALNAEQEWARLAPTLERVIEKFGQDLLRPQLSVDTYHVEVARKAIDAGIDFVNDVSGLSQTAMIELAAGSTIQFVAMHNLGLPADPAKTLDASRNAVDQVAEWLNDQLAVWTNAGIELNRIIFDPGIGFGKNPLQSLELLRGIDRFQDSGVRLLIGHSRKSFMKDLAGNDMRLRDLATIGSSMALCEQGVDILRVHNVPDHIAAYRGWAQLQSPN